MSEKELDQTHSLDPKDWASLQALGHRMVDEMFDSLKTVDARPPWQQIPDSVKAELKQPLPRKPQSPEFV